MKTPQMTSAVVASEADAREYALRENQKPPFNCEQHGVDAIQRRYDGLKRNIVVDLAATVSDCRRAARRTATAMRNRSAIITAACAAAAAIK